MQGRRERGDLSLVEDEHKGEGRGRTRELKNGMKDVMELAQAGFSTYP